MFGQDDRDKLDALNKRIEAAKEAVDPSSEKGHSALEKKNRGAVRGALLASDLLATIVGLGFCGWLADEKFGTRPWLMVVMIMVGFGAGMMIVMRALSDKPEEDSTKESSGEDRGQ